MENEQFELLMTEIKGINTKIANLEKSQAELKEEISNVRSELIGRINNVNDELRAEDKSIRQALHDSTLMLFNEIRALREEVKDYKQINEREHSMIIQLIEERFQESKRDREDLHEGLNTLHEAYKYNEIKHQEYEKVLSSIQEKF